MVYAIHLEQKSDGKGSTCRTVWTGMRDMSAPVDRLLVEPKRVHALQGHDDPQDAQQSQRSVCQTCRLDLVPPPSAERTDSSGQRCEEEVLR
jgi:hypothetical protein